MYIILTLKPQILRVIFIPPPSPPSCRDLARRVAESIEKIRSSVLGRKPSDLVKKVLSKPRKGVNNKFYGKKHTTQAWNSMRIAALNRSKLSKPLISVEITHLETKLTTTYQSIRKAAKAIYSDFKSFSLREKCQIENSVKTPYRGQYIIVLKRFEN